MLTAAKIKLEGHRILQNSNDDVAFIFLDSTGTQSVLQSVWEFPSRGFPGFASNDFMAISCGNPKSYKFVSVGGEVSMGNDQSFDMLVDLAGYEGQRGAPLFNPKGEVVAIMGGENENFPNRRHFTTFQDIDVQNFDSNTDLEHRLFEFFEGRKFQKKLSENNGHHGRTVFDCLGVGGSHWKTREYSDRNTIESDHFPPYDAYVHAIKDRNCPEKVKLKLRGGGKRPGENNLPAISIPKDIHRKLATTGSNKESVSFRSIQAKDIASGNFPEAIKKNFDDYFAKGLFRRSNYNCLQGTFSNLIKKYIQGFKTALEEHFNVGFLRNEDRYRLEGYIEALARNGHSSGEELGGNKIPSVAEEEIQ